MRTLFESSFFKSVRESIETSELPEPEILMDHFSGFSALLAPAVEKEESLLSLYRYLRLLHVEICSFFKQMEVCGLKNKSFLVTLLWKALNIIEVELDVVKLRIEHYGLAPESPKAANDAPVYWSEEYTVTDLMELIEALYKSGVLVYRDGRKVSRAALVRLFERAFNIEIKDARGLKRNVTTRKIKTTSFLNVLSANFIELRNS